MPSPHIGAEAITPVISATGRIQGNSAIPVYVYTSIPADRRGLGIAAQPVVFINDSDLVENGGQYKLQGRLTALPVIQMPAGSRSIGMPAIPVYDVTNKVWPPAFNPVVPTPPSSFPPITTGLQLDLQADAVGLSDPLGSWLDASGQHHDFTAVGAARPTFISDDGDGLPAISFDGLAQYLLGQNWAVLDNMPSFTLFFVAKGVGGITTGALLSKVNDDQNDQGWYVEGEGRQCYVQDQGTNNYTGINDGTTTPELANWHLHIYRLVNLNEIHAFLDGVSSGSGSQFGTVTTYSNTEPVRIGTDGTLFANGDQFQGKVRSIMLYSPMLSPADQAAMTTALKAKWGTP